MSQRKRACQTVTKIVQIIPADGWFARYVEDGKKYYLPLACFALIEHGKPDTGAVYPMVVITDDGDIYEVGDLGPAQDGNGFDGLQYHKDSPKDET